MPNITESLIKYIKILFSFFFMGDNDHIYRLIKIEMLPNEKDALLTYQVVGLNNLISKKLSQVYEYDIEGFSKLDARYIGLLYGNINNTRKTDLILTPANSNSIELTINPYIFFLTLILTSCLIISNLVGTKIINILSFEANAGVLFFPLILAISDITTEVYGYKVSRVIIWFAFCCNIIITLGIHLIVLLPHGQIWAYQNEYDTVFIFSTRTLLASAVAFLIGEFTNTYILAKLKILTMGRFLWLRALGSTIIGTALDNFIFYFIAFYNSLPNENLISIGLFGYIAGIIYEILILPIIYKVVFFLKSYEKKDIYDFGTNFNPFRF